MDKIILVYGNFGLFKILFASILKKTIMMVKEICLSRTRKKKQTVRVSCRLCASQQFIQMIYTHFWGKRETIHNLFCKCKIFSF